MTTAEVARRLHVLHVCAPSEGGAAVLALGQVRAQVERGWQVTLACPSIGGLGYAAREAGAEVVWWGSGGGPGEVVRLSRTVETTAPDVVHLHGTRAGRAGRLAVRGQVPTVLQPHGWDTLAPRGPARLRRWEQYADRWTSEVVVAGAPERRLAHGLGLRSPVTVLTPGLDLDRFRPAGSGERRWARRRLGLEDRPTVLCAGPLTVASGQQDLLVDWARVRARVPQAQLVLLGDGPDRRALERLAQRSAQGEPSVVFAGARADLPTWFAAADVVAVTTRWGGSGLASVAAMACGRSAVVSRADGQAEALAPAAGVVVDLDEPEALATALAARLSEPGLADAEGEQGRAHAVAHHDLRTSARELARVHLRVVATRRVG